MENISQDHLSINPFYNETIIALTHAYLDSIELYIKYAYKVNATATDEASAAEYLAISNTLQIEIYNLIKNA